MRDVIIAIISIIVVVVSVVFIVSRGCGSRREVPSRKMSDIIETWGCEAGHTFSAPAQKKPRRCQVEGCDREAYIILNFVCTGRDAHPIKVFYRADTHKVKLPNTDWIPFEEMEHYPCPKCGAVGLTPAIETPG